MSKLKCFMGNLDGKRQGMVVASSQSAAAKIAGTGLTSFRDYWREHSFPGDFEPSPLKLYTRRFFSDDAWQEGRCPI